MRIIAGEFRSRLLETPKDAETTRPMPDRVRVSIFGLLRGHCEGATVFDGFAGTGSMGLEAVSRGASRCVLVENDREVASLLRRNVEALGVVDRAEVVVGDALGAGALARAPRPLTLAFLDPPYPLIRSELGYRRVMARVSELVEILSPDGFVLLRTPWPMRVVASAEPPSTDPRPGRRGKGPRGRWNGGERPGRRQRGEREADGHDSGETEPVDVTAGDKPPARDVDLSIPNGVGPETHVYHSMAIHLYGRRRAGGARGAGEA